MYNDDGSTHSYVGPLHVIVQRPHVMFYTAKSAWQKMHRQCALCHSLSLQKLDDWNRRLVIRKTTTLWHNQMARVTHHLSQPNSRKRRFQRRERDRARHAAEATNKERRDCQDSESVTGPDEPSVPLKQQNKEKRDWQHGELPTRPDKLLRQKNKGKHVNINMML